MTRSRRASHRGTGENRIVLRSRRPSRSPARPFASPSIPSAAHFAAGFRTSASARALHAPDVRSHRRGQAREGATPSVSGVHRSRGPWVLRTFGGRSLPRRVSDRWQPARQGCREVACRVCHPFRWRSVHATDCPATTPRPRTVDVSARRPARAVAQALRRVHPRVGPDYIVNQALLVTFSRDREFQTWLGHFHPDDAMRIQELVHEQPRGGCPTRRRHDRVIQRGSERDGRISSER